MGIEDGEVGHVGFGWVPPESPGVVDVVPVVVDAACGLLLVSAGSNSFHRWTVIGCDHVLHGLNTCGCIQSQQIDQAESGVVLR